MSTLDESGNSKLNRYDKETAADDAVLRDYLRKLQRYRYAILIVIAALALAYTLVALGIYLAAPPQKTISLPFRLHFLGIDRGEYPNSLRFTSSEIVATPVLAAVWRANDLQRFCPFADFGSAVFVLETNPRLEELTRSYAVKLADARLNPIDRERLEREFQLKREGLTRSEYTLNFISTKRASRIPPGIATKALADILSVWAERVIREKGVLRYRVPVLSSNILNTRLLNSEEPIVGVDVLRSKIGVLIRSISDLMEIPGAEVLRTPKGQVSLAEAKVKLEDVSRLQLEPLVALARARGAATNPEAVLQYVSAQLVHNRQRSADGRARVDALRRAYLLYTEEAPDNSGGRLRQEQTNMDRDSNMGRDSKETIMPQIGESFLDRLVNLTNQSADREYRQGVVGEITRAELDVIPYESEVAHYERLLSQLAGVRRDSSESVNVAQVRTALQLAYKDVRQTVEEVNMLYAMLSEHFNSSRTLYAVSGSPVSRIERGASVRNLVLFGLLALLLALPLVLLWVFFHSRSETGAQGHSS